jgi:hypothetical protein
VADNVVAQGIRRADPGVVRFDRRYPMSDPVSAPWRLPVPREAVADSAGTSYWSVYEAAWLPANPPDEVAEYLAPPITVGTAPVGS